MKVDLAKDWAARARSRTGRHRLSGLAEGGGSSEGRHPGNDRLCQRLDAVLFPPRTRRQPKRGVGGTAFDFLTPGMVIIVKQVAGNSYALRSIPEVSGGMLVEEVHTGRVMAMQGGFDVVGSTYNRATQALRQPGSAFKPIVYVTALQNGFTPATIELDAPFCVWQGAGLGQKCFVNFDRRSAGPHTLRWGVEQSRNLMTVRAASTIGMPKITETARKLGVGDYGNYLSFALGAGDTTVLRLTNAYAILANQGRSVKPTTIDYVQDRNGKVIYRTDNRCAVMGNCNAPDWDGKAMPRPPSRTRQLVDADGRIPDGPRHGRRDPARHSDRASRPQPTAVRQDRHDQRPDQRLVRRRHSRHRRRRLSRLRYSRGPLGGCCTGRPNLGPDLEAMGADRAQGPAEDAVRRAARNSLGADRPGQRQAGVRRVPDHRRSPSPTVIWEAFQPQTEEQKSFKSSIGDPYKPISSSRRIQAAAQQAATAATTASSSRLSRRRRLRGNAAIRLLPSADAVRLANQNEHFEIRRSLGPARRELDRCAPKRRPISTRSMPRPRCCAASSIGTAR